MTWTVESNSIENNLFIESLFSLGNGYMGMRGNFEEEFTGDTHRGFYIGGIWYPDKTRVGWWKNGYPNYFGKAINCVNIIGLKIYLDDKEIDIHKLKYRNFHRKLDLHDAVLYRSFELETEKGIVKFNFERFVSLHKKELLAIKVNIISDYNVKIKLVPYLDSNVSNVDANYEEKFWKPITFDKTDNSISILSSTKENNFGVEQFYVSASMACSSNILPQKNYSFTSSYCEMIYEGLLHKNTDLEFIKYSSIYTSREKPIDMLNELSMKLTDESILYKYDYHKSKHIELWQKRWENCDVVIEGDEKSQQGIRFNLFHLLSTYSGHDSKLNIGPKGFTGEKYGGATYWDTEAYCLPVYQSITENTVAKNLLLYRHNQLEEAYINAQAQGLNGALFPMVTFNGLECHNEWEITFEEIHRNSAIVYAIYNYTKYTNDESYILDKGFDVICGVARFWQSRVHFSKNAGKYMIHGVTGPNEYENNVNNNWYTNRMASWVLELFYTLCEKVSKSKIEEHNITEEELTEVKKIYTNIYLPYSKEKNIFVQHDTFLDKEIITVDKIPKSERPINQHWSWDKILRSCYIKQADVLQGLYFLKHLYSKEEIKNNFDFYEPLTVHESSLSPCIHSILASYLGYKEKAFEMYIRTSRLDLDNVNNDTEDGLHITSMAGSWLSIVQGFAGMSYFEGFLEFSPYLPDKWSKYSFNINYQNRLIHIEVNEQSVIVKKLKGEKLTISLYDKKYELNDFINIKIQTK